MPETLIKVDLNQSPYENENIHNRWHPDIPMATWVNPGDDFVLETYDWTGGFIKNNNSADDVRDIGSLFYDAKQSAKILAASADKYLQ